MSAQSGWQFRPRWSVSLATVVLGALMVWAGGWQLRRGFEKHALLAAHAEALRSTPKPIATLPDAPARGLRLPATAQGVYRPEQSLLLDNQSHEHRPGVHVWTALQLDDGSRVVIDRGWIPLDQTPSPPPAGPQTISGLWRALPQPGLRLGVAVGDCQPLAGGSRVNYPDIAQLRCQWGSALRDGLLELDPALPGGFVRTWAAEAEAVPPSRHFAYAAQWWLFSATLLFFYIRLNLRRPAFHD